MFVANGDVWIENCVAVALVTGRRPSDGDGTIWFRGSCQDQWDQKAWNCSTNCALGTALNLGLSDGSISLCSRCIDGQLEKKNLLRNDGKKEGGTKGTGLFVNGRYEQRKSFAHVWGHSFLICANTKVHWKRVKHWFEFFIDLCWYAIQPFIDPLSGDRRLSHGHREEDRVLVKKIVGPAEKKRLVWQYILASCVILLRWTRPEAKARADQPREWQGLGWSGSIDDAKLYLCKSAQIVPVGYVWLQKASSWQQAPMFLLVAISDYLSTVSFWLRVAGMWLKDWYLRNTMRERTKSKPRTCSLLVEARCMGLAKGSHRNSTTMGLAKGSHRNSMQQWELLMAAQEKKCGAIELGIVDVGARDWSRSMAAVWLMCRVKGPGAKQQVFRVVMALPCDQASAVFEE